MRFEWDGRKAALNLFKHGISFSDATAVFDDPNALSRRDFTHSETEKRFHILGISPVGIIEVVYTPRSNRARLISARRASRHERRLYASAQR